MKILPGRCSTPSSSCSSTKDAEIPRRDGFHDCHAQRAFSEVVLSELLRPRLALAGRAGRAVHAQAEYPFIKGVSQLAVQVGTTAQVDVLGFTTPITGALVAGGGITVEPVPEKPGFRSAWLPTPCPASAISAC